MNKMFLVLFLLLVFVPAGHATAANRSGGAGKNSSLQTGLVNAITNGDIDTIRILLNRGAKVNASHVAGVYLNYVGARDGSILLFTTTDHRMIKISAQQWMDILTLIDRPGLNYNNLAIDVQYMGKVPLIFSLEDWRDVDWFAKRGLDLNKKREYGLTALTFAVRNDKTEEGLKEIAATGGIKEGYVEPKQKAVDLFRYYLTKADVNSRYTESWDTSSMNEKYFAKATPLNVAIHQGKLYTTWLYLLQKPNLNLKDSQGKTVMDYAIETGNSNMIKLVQSALDGKLQKFPNLDIYLNPSAGPLPKEDQTKITRQEQGNIQPVAQASTATSSVNSDTLNNVIGSGLKLLGSMLK